MPTDEEIATAFANGLAEADLITNLHQLKSQYDSLLPPDPNAAVRHLVALKMQAIQFRLERIV